jgi:hypothetical protein
VIQVWRVVLIPVRSILSVVAALIVLLMPTLSWAQRPPEVWKLSGKPRTVIGAPDEDSMPEFKSIAGGKYYPTSQMIVVVDGEGNTILVYDARSGKRVRSFGRTGRGPGEGMYFTLPSFFGDTIKASDPALKRISTWLFSGKYLNVRAIPLAGERNSWASYPLAGGSILLHWWERRPRTGQAEDSIYVYVAPSGLTPRFLAALYRTTEIGAGEGDYRVGLPVMLASSYLTVVSGDGFWISEGKDPVITRYRHDGTRTTQARLPFAPDRISKNDREIAEAMALAGFSEKSPARAMFKESLSKVEYPKLLPAIALLARSDDGGVWAARWPHPADTVRTWYVVGKDGRVRAQIDLPSTLEVLDAGENWVLISRRTAEGGNEVLLYDVVRGQ